MKTKPFTPECLEQIPLFHGLTAAECSQLMEIAVSRTFQPGEVVLQQGGKSQELWVLLEGTCEVFKEAEGGRPAFVLATLEPFSNFGEMSFFHAAPHSASVRASSRVKLLCIGRGRFDELSRREPVLAYKLASNTVGGLADRLRRMDQWVGDLLSKDAAEQRPSEWSQLRDKLFESWTL